MTHVAVILSGCGVYDGAEIYESVFTLFHLERAGATVTCLAPDIEQAHVINHLTGEVAEGETRNVRVEAARIVRGEVNDLAEADPGAFDAVILPGGFGVAKNLSDFAFKGDDCTVQPDVRRFIQTMKEQGKPVGLACIAPVLSARLLGEGVRCTVGNDEDIAGAIESMGAVHVPCPVTEAVVDEEHKLVTTPAYMLAEQLSDAWDGLGRMVEEVMRLARG